MKKLLFLCLFVLAKCSGTLAQEGAAKDRLDIFVASQLYLNKLNVRNDERYPSTISSKNTQGFYLGLTYSQFVKRHWIFSGELGYGQAYHNVKFTVPTNIYDSAVTAALGPTVSLSSNTKIRYAQLSFWAGYQFDVNNRWTIEGRIGFAQRIRIGGEWESKSVTALVTDPSGNMTYKTLISYVNALGANSYQQGINYGNLTGELYLGCRKRISNFFANSFQFGLVCSRNVFTPDPARIYVNTYGSGTVLPISHDRYEDLNMAIGIRIGASLW